MGGQRKNTIRFKSKKSHGKGVKVNSAKSYKRQSAQDTDTIVVPLWYSLLVEDKTLDVDF